MNQIPFPPMPSTPFGNLPPMPGAPPPFPGQAQAPIKRTVELEVDSDPISVFFGKAAESVVDVATFGIFQPDIVPDWAERASPLATTLGNVAGSIAGFAPSFGVSSIAAKGILGAFRYTRRLQKAAEGLEAVQTIKPFGKTLIQGMKETGLTFAIHDAAREIVDQTKTNNLDIYEVAHKAVNGALGGAIIGLGGTYSHYLSPIAQAVTMGATMTMAEVITDAAAGEDVKSADYIKTRIPQAFLTGTLVGLWNSRGWKERSEGIGKALRDDYHEFSTQKNFLDANGEPTLASSKMITSVMTQLQKHGVKEFDAFKGFPPEMIDALTTANKRGWNPYSQNLKNQEVSAHRRIKEMQGVLKWDDDFYRAFLKEHGGGKDSTMKMNLEEKVHVYEEMVRPIREVAGAFRGQFTEPGWIESNLSPRDHINLVHGFEGIVAQPTAAKRLMLLEKEKLKNVVNGGIFVPFYNAYKAGEASGWKPQAVTETPPPGQGIFKTAAKAFAKWKQKPEDADELFRLALTDPKFDRTVMSPKMNKLVDEYQAITKMMLERTNATLISIGENPIPERQFYMHHEYDYAAGKRMGVSRSQMPDPNFLGAQDRYIKDPLNPTKFQQTGETPYIRSPREAMYSMLNYDLKTIYLTEPGRIFDQKLKSLVKQNLIEPAEVDHLKGWYNTVILGQKSKSIEKVGRTWDRFLETNKLGSFFDKYAAELNVNLGENPQQALSHFLGVNITRAFLGFRPKLDLRNATQFMYGHAFSSTRDMAIGLSPTFDKHPQYAIYKEWKDTSLTRASFVSQGAEEYARYEKFGVMGNVDKMSMANYQRGSVASFDLGAQGNFVTAIRRITEPGKRYLNWQDPEGIRLRNTSGNKNAITPREKEWLFKQLDEVSTNINFDYTVLSMPMITSSIAAPLTKLMSFPMNYTYKYMGSIVNQMTTRTPLWAKDMGANAPKIEKSIAWGALPKHFIGLSIFAAAMEATFGIDFSSVVGISYNPMKDQDKNTLPLLPFGLTEHRGLRVGVWDIRPNPATTLFTTLKDMFSNDERTRNEASKRLKTLNGVPIPYITAARDINKLAETGEMKGYIFYEPRAPKAKKSKPNLPFPNVGGGTNPFE